MKVVQLILYLGARAGAGIHFFVVFRVTLRTPTHPRTLAPTTAFRPHSGSSRKAVHVQLCVR